VKSLSVVVLLALLSGCAKKSDAIAYGNVPDFSLTERSNRKVTKQDLVGKVWVADFIFTHCAGICPTMSANMQKLQDKLPAEVRLVSFSVDPYNDTPEVLTEYANRYGADRERWLFLTGEPGAVQKLSFEGFKLAIDTTSGSAAEPITHSSRYALVDKEGTIRGYFGTEEPDALDRIVEAAKKLL
jgi:protein SCO1/2